MTHSITRLQHNLICNKMVRMKLQPKTHNLIATRISRISRDNKFNITTVALSLCSIVISCAFELTQVGNIVPFVIFFALGFMNKVSFKNGRFFNSQGMDISNNLPKTFATWYTIVLVIFFVLSITNIISRWDNYNFPLNNFIGMLFTGLMPYFIYKGCPISMMLNQHAWRQAKKVFGFSHMMCCYNNPSIPEFKKIDTLNDPRYSGFSSNTNNYYHWHRN